MWGIARTPPTLAAPSVRALVAGFEAMLRPAAYRDELRRQLRCVGHTSRVVPFSSGRAALATAITVAMRATGRRVVVIPAYTSFSVAAAVAAAGARARLCDLDPTDLDFDGPDLRACVDRDTAAVVLGNLFGFPSSFTSLGWVRERGALVVDDAAQALGADSRSGPVGGRGDLGVLSFGRGKCVTTGEGGALLMHDPELTPLLSEPQRCRGRGLRSWLTASAVRVSANPTLFGLLSRMPGARIGESRYDPGFDLCAPPPSVYGLASDLAMAVRRQLTIRRRTAQMWERVLEGTTRVRPVVSRAGAHPSYLRMPVLATDGTSREELADELGRAGLRYVRSYPTTLDAISSFRAGYCEDRAIPGAQRIARTLLALPCHEGLRPRDLERAGTILNDASHRFRPAASTRERLASPT